MKTVPRHLIDDLIERSREYWHDDTQDTKPVQEAAFALEKATNVWVYSWWGFVGHIVCRSGFMPDATNEDIYNVLRAMGFEIIEEKN